MEIQERTESIVSLTPAAAAKIRDLMATEEDVSVLRVAIEAAGAPVSSTASASTAAPRRATSSSSARA